MLCQKTKKDWQPSKSYRLVVATGMTTDNGLPLYAHYEFTTDKNAHVTNIASERQLCTFKCRLHEGGGFNRCDSEVVLPFDIIQNIEENLLADVHVEIKNGSHFNGLGCFLCVDMCP